METLPNDWDEVQKSLNASILQSRVWADFQQTLGRKTYFEWSNHWSWVGYEHNLNALKYLFLPYGPTISLSGRSALESLQKLAKTENFDFIRLEPKGRINSEEIEALGGIKTVDIEPSATQIIDLSQTEDQLRRGLNSGHRNLINGASRRGLEVRTSDSDEDYKVFVKMLNETARRAQVKFHPEEYFWKLKEVLMPKGNAKLYVVDHVEGPVAAALFYDYNGVRYYAHAGAFQKINRRLNGSVVLLWQSILDAKSAGMKTVDLWGIAGSDNPKHKWAGITKFKKGFGGQSLSYLGTYDLSLKSAKYQTYRVVQKLRGRI